MKKKDEFSAGPDTQCMVYYSIFTYIWCIFMENVGQLIYPYNIECLGGMNLKQGHIGVNKSVYDGFCGYFLEGWPILDVFVNRQIWDTHFGCLESTWQQNYP